MKKISWGIIGCGDVTELKSGPAFNKVPNSSLIAVMRRNTEKAKDYAVRHQVPRWYDDADKLINDPEVNAVYVATPPSTHEAYTIAAIAAGKFVYVEKPMAMNYEQAINMTNAAAAEDVKLVVAHYRREQPFFKKIKQLLADKTIGDIRMARIELHKSLPGEEELKEEKTAWRINPAIAGGGFFHDLAPHQLDLMCYFFGPVQKVHGIAINQGEAYTADDAVAGNILFENGVVFSGSWCFNVAPGYETDLCEITGSKGKMSFSVFGGNIITVAANKKTSVFSFDMLQHVQQPMIEKTVQYFLGESSNPCTGHEGAQVMWLMDEFVKWKHR